ncbi:hypothetical protein GCM10010174_06060 [Kutzneria viridogrisea]|uniref:Uncharacterized protein n=2 Tax=Kutzneria TaxID=43356 RepID=W5WA26_9PSEU|nr:hypothetical protein KALB_4621 [Kutzneria albida DSM 43870]MBA8924360.1 hypothetical protein [Kutzneria viridogrisea]
MSEREPPQYAVARVQRAIAEDPRTVELGVRVTVRGDQVFLRGDVTCQARRDDLTEVVAELAPELLVRNEIRVVPSGAPEGREELL